MSEFEHQMRDYLPLFQSALATEIGDWAVKGFIDTHRNIYTISSDTKVISKLIELMASSLSKLHPLIIKAEHFAVPNHSAAAKIALSSSALN